MKPINTISCHTKTSSNFIHGYFEKCNAYLCSTPKNSWVYRKDTKGLNQLGKQRLFYVYRVLEKWIKMKILKLGLLPEKGANMQTDVQKSITQVNVTFCFCQENSNLPSWIFCFYLRFKMHTPLRTILPEISCNLSSIWEI